jgi:hypothetical protein
MVFMTLNFIGRSMNFPRTAVHTKRELTTRLHKKDLLVLVACQCEQTREPQCSIDILVRKRHVRFRSAACPARRGG